MALDTFNPYLFVSAGEQSNKYLTPTYAGGIAKFQTQRAEQLTKLTVQFGTIQEGTGDPAPDNVRPISGRTGLTLTQVGKNIAKPVATTATLAGVSWAVTDDGKVTANGTATGNTQVNFNLVNNVLQLPKNVPLIISGSTAELAVRVCYRTIDAPSTTVTLATSYDGADATGTIPDNAKDSWIRVLNAAGTGVEINAECYPMVRLSGNADYEPYRGNTYTVTWETEAGTVYGGTLDVVSGVLTVNGVLHTLTGEENFGLATNSRRFTAAFTTLEWERANTEVSTQNQSNSICSHATYLTGATATATPADYRISTDTSGRQAINFYDTQSEFASAEAFNAYLAAQYANGTPVQLYYDLATPLEPIQLTPTDVKTLAGYNQIYSDAGPVIDIKF